MAVRNSANNAWIVNLNNGNMNNNNTYNRYFVCGASESFPNADGWIDAERSFYKNKHDSIGAQRIHIHPARLRRIARLVESVDYSPKPGYCFPILEPTPREIFASFCDDRLVHHYVAPFIAEVAECVHKANGDVSHGNRIGHSAQTGAEQIRDAIREAMKLYPEPYVVKIDIRSFFSSIPRERAFKCLEHYAREYYTKEDLEEKLAICKKLILHDPTKGCIQLSSQMKWSKVPERKRLRNSPEGCGLPIGNFYSQLVANLYLAVLDARLRKYGICPRFVDDKTGILKSKREAKHFIKEAQEVASLLGLILHPDKVYIQPAHRGVPFCGRVVKGERIYLSNTTLKRAHGRVLMLPIGEEGARQAVETANSYLGLMKHCTEWKNAVRLMRDVSRRFKRWTYFVLRDGFLVCRIRARFSVRRLYQRRIINLISLYYETWKDYQRSPRPLGLRGWAGGWRESVGAGVAC